MAVYKPTYCYPYLEPVDLTIPDGEKYFTCQIDTSNIKITGYRVELYNENNEKVFPLNEGKISPLSELNDTDGTLGLNGSELRFPFVQHWDSKIYPSYNAIYFKATNYVDYFQKVNESVDLEGAQIKNGCLNDSNGEPIFIDGSSLFVGDIFILVNKLYKVTLDGVVEDSLSATAIIYVKGGDTNAGSILSYNGSEFVDASRSAWCDISGNLLTISNNGKTYKWQITLYSGERGTIRTTNEENGATEIGYSAMADNEFNTILTSGTILGSTEDRIQGPISDKIYAKQWLQLLKKDENNNWVQVGIRTYIESYSQTLGCIYPISGDSRGFNNSDLYGDEPATHFAVYKYSNDPDSMTSQNSVDESINFVLTKSGASHVTGTYSYEVTGSTQAEALENIKKFNAKCVEKKSTPLCEISSDGTSGVYSGKSVLIWNESSTTENPLTGYFTISFSLVNGSNNEKIPKFVFDMAYAYRKVSSYIGKVFFVQEGSFANQNIVSKAEATGENDVASLGFPITFVEEEPLEIYPSAPSAADKLYGEIYKNGVKDGIGTVYVSPFVGLQAGARLYISDGTVVKAQTVDTTTWAVTYDATAPASTSAYSSTNPLKYEIRTNFKSSDETPFYAYDTPRLVPWSEQALSVVDTNGYEFLLEFLGQILTVPTVFSSEIHARYVHVTGQYLQAQNVSWTSYRWLLVDEYGQVIQDTGKQYDSLIETTFYGLSGPTVADVEAGTAVPTTYYPVLIVEDELGNSLIMGMEISVSLNPRNLPMEFSGGFDCKTQSVIMKIMDYGYPKFSQDSENKAMVLDTSKGVDYQIKEESGGTAQVPVNPIEIGDKLTKFYFDTAKTPDFSSFDWTNPDDIDNNNNPLINIIQSEEHYNDGKEDIGSDGIVVLRRDYSSKDPSNPYRYTLVAIAWLILWTNDEYAHQQSPSSYPAPGWNYVGGPGGVIEPNTNSTSADFASFIGSLTAKNIKYQDIWGAYISKDGQWKSGGGSKVVSGEVKILGLDQQEQLSSFAANQVKIPTKGAQLKHFFAKDTIEIPDLSNAPKKLATNNKGNIEFHTKVKLDANFCGEILKYTVDIGNALGSTDKLNISLELPSNFTTQEEHRGNTLRGNRNQVKCTVSAKGSSKSASGVELFTSPTANQEAYYLQPSSWIDSSNGDLDKGNISCEYLDFEFAIDASGKEYNGSDTAHQPVLYNINEPINTMAKRNIGECCLQVDGGNYFNKWTDLKRVQIDTSAGQQGVETSGYRVVRTTEPAVWDDIDTSSGKPMVWTEGWSETADTTMVQVKRHAEVATKTWLIDCYMKDIDELFDIAPTLGVAYSSNQWTVSATNNNQTKNYIFLRMKEVAQ